MNVAHRFTAGRLIVPALVELKRGHLHWRMSVGSRGPLEPDPEPAMLRTFVALAAGQTAAGEFLRYAQRWGMLNICRHHVPGAHAELRKLRGKVALVWCVPPGGWGPQGRERIEDWRATARDLAALLSVGIELRRDRLGRLSDWATVIPTPTLSDQEQFRSLEGQRLRFARLLTDRLLRARARMEFEWVGDAPRVAFAGNGLYGHLLVQLGLAVGRSEGQFICAACGLPYLRMGGVNSRRHTYCQKCSKRGAWRVNKADYRAAIREARRRHAAGEHVRGISRALGRREDLIRKWVS